MTSRGGLNIIYHNSRGSVSHFSPGEDACGYLIYTGFLWGIHNTYHTPMEVPHIPLYEGYSCGHLRPYIRISGEVLIGSPTMSGSQIFVPNPDVLAYRVRDLVRIWPKNLNFTLKSDICKFCPDFKACNKS